MITISELDFSYNRKEQILHNLNMHVPKGAIYGFLGANGAGKSTTIRAILGLLKPNKGTIQVLGSHDLSKNPSIFAQIGSLIEAPSIYGHLNARQNLKIISRYHHQNYLSIDEVLEKVGLAKTNNKKVSNFSMGMKQRLGLGMAMIHDPDLLILDEPVNGLDPNGILEIRQILEQLKSDGKTILLSSHLLSEIEKIASHVGIIKDGQMVFEGEIHQLLSLQKSNFSILVKSNNIEKIKKHYSNTCRVISEDVCSLAVNNEQEIPTIIKDLMDLQIAIYEIKQVKDNLENLFMDLTNNSN